MKDLLFRSLAWILTIPLLIIAVGFAFFHTEIVGVTIAPWLAPIPLPLYIPVLTAIGCGFFFGALMTWAAGGRLRDRAREQKKRITALEKQLSIANQNTYSSHNYSETPSQFMTQKLLK
jgi:uncharacterized integral membrane protein